MKYHDPLHIPSAERVVWHKGVEALILNKELLDQQNCWTNLDKIKELHSERLHLCDMMMESDDIDFLTLCDAYYTLIEFELQEAWGFPLDKKFHMFWRRVKCECAKLDNQDAYPFGYYSISGGCPLHGS
jgi:hypothetical protein